MWIFILYFQISIPFWQPMMMVLAVLLFHMLQRRTTFPRFPRLVKNYFERSPAEHTNMRILVHIPALIITQNFAHQRDILEPFNCFPHCCSLASCALQNVSWWTVFCVLFTAKGLRLLHDFILHLLQNQWANAQSNTTWLCGFAWFVNSRNGCSRGSGCCCRQWLQICNSSHARMVSCLSWFPWIPPPRP